MLAQRPSCRVIFVTAYSLFQYAHEAVHLGACDYLLKPVDPDELEASVRRAMRQIETERKLEELAAAQPEQTETEEEAEDAPEEGENSQTALVMAHVRRYLEDNYMFDLSLDSVGEILHISPAYLVGAVQEIPEDELPRLPHRAAHQRGKGTAGRPLPLLGGGGVDGGLRGRQLLRPGVQETHRP